MKHLIFMLLCLQLLATPVHTRFAQLNSTSGITRKDIQFYSGINLVKGWLFHPAETAGKKFPVIVMAPGFAGVKESNYRFIADEFAAAGFAVVLFDYPNFGESEGKPRQEADPLLQVQAYRDAITYATGNPLIDGESIGVWGGSYSGGHAILVAALDSRVKCFVAMTPFLSGNALIRNKSMAARKKRGEAFNADRINRMNGKTPAMIPVVSEKGGAMVAAPSPYAWQFVQSFISYAPNFKNEVTLRSIEMQFEYEPAAYLNRTDSIPKLFLIAKQDELIPETFIKNYYDAAPGPKELVYFEGHHFSAYQEKRKETCGYAIAFFKKYLKEL
ncbi:MAG: alpha/beta fold hydrolase [Chitinophagaceae bacterium]|nr:alpha/beta fold hydrolase [Chitinophagaceae bacterium]